MNDNPMIQKVFAGAHSRRAAAVGEIYAAIMRQQQMRGLILGAEVQGIVVAVVPLVQPGRCQPGTLENLALLKTVQSSTSMEMMLAWKKWRAAWALRDPKDAHWHLGPVAVEPEFQGRGIGTVLLQGACEYIDRFPAQAYVETDRRETLPFFEKAGFRETAEAAVLGISNWFLIRPRQK